ncbi:ribbon-helix-helix protein, CopG family [Lentzea flaviverrucosa]|uniref:Ribbon-helix-helix protein, copG family n=1 Tax=Lentzea flaviverrucosa TaxID=200379 RepID=A0A1H9VVK0_9PSEU|nr:ribbon-helix-helix protein, CopG family [Lentzea flaviverrucosa]RDI23607.1 ribbon-helix-helix CopG family protein [Lentzea flaviverrucosa]SES25551.1 Ribbon-helix-helix protein, copG family [Lentzea flaviverrucosa]
MDLTPYVASLGRELLTAVETGGEEAGALVERLTVTMESAIRLALLEALSAAADEITADLAPDSVQVLLRGRDPKFVVTRRAPEQPAAVAPEPTPAAPAEDVAAGFDDGTTVRINVRLPEPLKAAIDEAAAKEGRSANAWLVRAASAQLSPKRDTIAETIENSITGSQRFVGWVR